MDQQTFIKERNKWLKEVAEKCHQLALNPEMKCDFDFYVFQSSCNYYNPNLLIIGINPGGDKRYTSLLEELKLKGEDKRSAFSLGYNLSGLEENINTLVTKPSWEIEKQEKGGDKMRASFSRVFINGTPMRKMLEEAVAMNRYYFNTNGTSELEKIRDPARAFCINKTLDFIDILNPANILFYGGEPDLKRRYNIEFNSIGNNVKKGILKGRLIYIIPHYASHGNAWSKDNGEKMGETLLKEFL